MIEVLEIWNNTQNEAIFSFHSAVSIEKRTLPFFGTSIFFLFEDPVQYFTVWTSSTKVYQRDYQ